jgi:Tol biopolymer transport system component
MPKKATLMILLTSLLTVPLSADASAAEPVDQPIGLFEGRADIGRISEPGSSVYDAERQEYMVGGSGANMWFDRDDFHFLWKRMRGDFILRTRARFLGEGRHPHRKMGWIVRSGLDPHAAYADVAVHGDGLTALQFRRTAGGDTEEVRSAVMAPDVIQLSRKGSTYTMSVARFGEPFAREQVSDLDLGDEVYVGLFVCSHTEDATERAAFRDVRIVIPAADDLVPYQEYIGSNLEILDIETGDREIVYRTPDSLQAPNWTPDGKELIYNRNGLLYRFPLDSRTPLALDTGFANRNNNDHVLSFDGGMLGISHHDEEQEGLSIVYTVPVGGGTPTRVTPTGPSYLHGWSPDGRFLVYTAERDGDYDIYRIPASGGEETRLTSTQGLDDGSEYSPDGRYIYFNSVRSGSMEIWRMKPDGSGPEQMTDDPLNNWFPHVSPDGGRIAFLSYSDDVAPDDHPFYKEVYLRLMSPNGGEPRVIAYLYGGQGTINVPSWAPDSRRLAFVSNSVTE